MFLRYQASKFEVYMRKLQMQYWLKTVYSLQFETLKSGTSVCQGLVLCIVVLRNMSSKFEMKRVKNIFATCGFKSATFLPTLQFTKCSHKDIILMPTVSHAVL